MATQKTTKAKKTTKTVSKTTKKPKVKIVKKAPAKKTTSKKPAAKKSSPKTTAKGKVLVCAKGKECFWTNDGQVLKDLLELRDALKKMTDKVYTHHVTKEKNDFADWVEAVLKDVDCATALRKSKKPNTARTVVVRHLRTYHL